MSLSSLSQLNHKSKDQKPHINKLAADNSNQQEWLRSVRTWARANSAEIFFLKKMNRRRNPAASDLSAEGAFPIVKLEAEASPTKRTTTSDKTTEAKDDLDDYERVFFDNTVIFQDEHGQDESQEARAIRFKLTQALTQSLPHHQHKLVTWTEGDVYQLITLVLINIKHTKRSLYNTHCQLHEIRFEQGHKVDDIINQLHAIQLRANRITPDFITLDLVRGALLTALMRQAP